MEFTAQEKAHLRRLAQEYPEIANLPIMEERKNSGTATMPVK